jgi:hypothetical protein
MPFAIVAALLCAQWVFAADVPWTGSTQCQLTVQTPNYTHIETQTWAIAGAPKLQGSLDVYPATWSVNGQGSRQDSQGVQISTMQWVVNVAPMEAPLVSFVRPSDKQLIIKPYHAQLRSNTGVSITRQRMGMRLPPQSGAEYEWQFPLVQDVSTSTGISGSSSDAITAGIGPMQPAGLPGKVTCSWHFVRGGPVVVASIEPKQRMIQLSNSLDASTKAWVAQQAQVVAKVPQPDVSQVESQVRARYFSAEGNMPALPKDVDVDSLAAIVMMEAAKDQEQELRDLLDEVQKQNATRRQLSQMMDQLSQDASSSKTNMVNGVCTTPRCQALAEALQRLPVTMPPITKAAQLAATGDLTNVKLQQILGQMKMAKDSMDLLSQEQQARLQAYKERKSKMEETLANLLKKISDTNSAIIGNMK